MKALSSGSLSRLGFFFFCFLFALTAARLSHAGSATWNLNPISNDWNNANNWTPTTVPNGDFDVATFNASNTTNIAITDQLSTTIGGIIFNAGASSFTFTANRPALVYVEGPITNQSGKAQNFVIGPFNSINFNAASTAGTLTTYGIQGSMTSGVYGASIGFSSVASADGATITIDGGTVTGAKLAFLVFSDSATAAQSTLIANGGIAGGPGGSIRFFDTSSGGNARVEIFGNGDLRIANHDSPGLTIGSIEGDGRVFLGSNTLTVGNNGLNTAFNGGIRDEAPGGSLVKIGSGRLTLNGASIYHGGTNINGGELAIATTSGSATGYGPVQISRGQLSGSGHIAGAVTAGLGNGPGAIFQPGNGVRPDTIDVQSNLMFNADSSYNCLLNSNSDRASKIIADGVSISRGALFNLVDTGSSSLSLGTAFTVINNNAATPIVGTFSNLADGSTLTVGNNTFQANYAGGDGNDLTLTVVP